MSYTLLITFEADFSLHKATSIQESQRMFNHLTCKGGHPGLCAHSQCWISCGSKQGPWWFLTPCHMQEKVPAFSLSLTGDYTTSWLWSQLWAPFTFPKIFEPKEHVRKVSFALHLQRQQVWPYGLLATRLGSLFCPFPKCLPPWDTLILYVSNISRDHILSYTSFCHTQKSSIEHIQH